MLVLILAIAAASVVLGQPSAKAPSFEVASVKPNLSGNSAIGNLQICGSGGRVLVLNAPLDLIIQRAYELKEFQLLGRPSWLASERFDIAAKPQTPVRVGECQLMLRTLLADRFRLAIHRDTRQMPVYRLVVAKNGPRLHKVAPDAPLGTKTFNTVTGQLVTRGSSIPELAAMLASTGELENKVVDATGLAGYYEFSLEWKPENAAAEGTQGPSLFLALQEQLGLKLEATKGPVPVSIIDHIEKIPTGN